MGTSKMCVRTNWYLQVKDVLIKLGANVSSADPCIFYLKKNNYLIGILASNMDMIWGGNGNFKVDIIEKLKNTLMFGSKNTDALTCLGIQLTKNTDFSSSINQNNCISCISETASSKKRMKDKNIALNSKKA